MLIMIIKYARGYLDVIWEPATEKMRESIIMMDDDGINIHTITSTISGSTTPPQPQNELSLIGTVY